MVVDRKGRDLASLFSAEFLSISQVEDVCLFHHNISKLECLFIRNVLVHHNFFAKAEMCLAINKMCICLSKILIFIDSEA